MSGSEDGPLANTVRAIPARTARTHESSGGELDSSLGSSESAADGEPKPAESMRRVTTRLRMQRISLMPFVPAPLYEYVDRVRERRRLRWVLVLVGVAVVAAIGLVLRGSRTTDPPPTARNASEVPVNASVAFTVTSASAPVASIAEPRAVVVPPALPSVTSDRSATTGQKVLTEARTRAVSSAEIRGPKPSREESAHEEPPKPKLSAETVQPPSWWW